MLPIVLFLIFFVLWSVIHSLLASAAFKAWIRQRVGEVRFAGFYRFAYSAFATLTFLPLFVMAAFLPDDFTVWQVTGWGAWLLWGLRLVGLLGAAYTILETGGMQFVGITQVFDFFAGRETQEDKGKLMTTGTYSLMRHPLYTFSILFLWASPTMTRNGLLFNGAITLYFVIGSIYEERRLRAQFGEAYARYQTQAGRFLPRLRRSA